MYQVKIAILYLLAYLYLTSSLVCEPLQLVQQYINLFHKLAIQTQVNESNRDLRIKFVGGIISYPITKDVGVSIVSAVAQKPYSLLSP